MLKEPLPGRTQSSPGYHSSGATPAATSRPTRQDETVRTVDVAWTTRLCTGV